MTPFNAVGTYELAPGDALASAFVRGKAYLAAHRTSEAADEFQRILDNPGVVGSAPWGALAHIGLAHAYAMQGDTAKAIEQGKDRAAEHTRVYLRKAANLELPSLQWKKSRSVWSNTALIHAQQPDQSIFLEAPGSGTTGGNVAKRNYPVS